jgi:hypothetical protein
MNKLLQHIIDAGDVDHRVLPGLQKMQTGGTDWLSKYKQDLKNMPNVNLSSNDNIPRQPAYVKEYEQQQQYLKNKKEREQKELQQREFNNRTYISQDRSTPASREADRQRRLEAQRQEAMANSELAQTFGSFTPSGNNSAAGAVAANQFVKTVPIILAGAAGASALPSVLAGLNAPIAGVAGLTGTNLINAGFAYQGAKNIPNVANSIKKAYQNPTWGNVGNAALETGVTALDMVPFAAEAAPGVRAAVNASKESGVLSNAYKVNPFAFKPKSDAAYRMIGNEGYADALNSGVIRPPKGSNHDYAYYNKGYPLDTKLRDATGRAGYEGPYMAEVKGNKDLFVDENVASYTGPMFDDPVVYSKKPISIYDPNVKLYKQDWLQGYKQVKQPTPEFSKVPDLSGNVSGLPIDLTRPNLSIAEGNVMRNELEPKNQIARFEIDKMAKRENDWINSDEYLKRRMAASGETAEQVKADVAKISERFKRTDVITAPIGNSAAGYYSKEYTPNVIGKQIFGKQSINPKVVVGDNVPRDEGLATLDHEIKHAFSQVSNTEPNYKGYPTIKLGNWFQRNIAGIGKKADNIQYLNRPSEQQVRNLELLDHIEESEGIKRGQQISSKNLHDFLKKISQDDNVNSYARRYSDVADYVNEIANKYGKDKLYPARKRLLDALNKSYAVPGAVGIGAAAMGAKEQKYGGENNMFGVFAEDGVEYKGPSIVDYLATKGYSGNKAFRKGLAEKYGVEDYNYSAAKNTELLNKLRENDDLLEKEYEQTQAPIAVEKMMQMEQRQAAPVRNTQPLYRPAFMDMEVPKTKVNLSLQPKVVYDKFSLKPKMVIPMPLTPAKAAVNTPAPVVQPVASPTPQINIPKFDPYSYMTSGVQNPVVAAPTVNTPVPFNSNTAFNNYNPAEPFAFLKQKPNALGPYLPANKPAVDTKMNDSKPEVKTAWYEDLYNDFEDAVNKSGLDFSKMTMAPSGFTPEGAQAMVKDITVRAAGLISPEKGKLVDNYFKRQDLKNNDNLQETKTKFNIPTSGRPAIATGDTINIDKNRYVIPAMIDLNQTNWDTRNRGEYKDIDTEAADITTFQSFEKAKDYFAKNAKDANNSTYIGVDAAGKIKVGNKADFVNTDYRITKTFGNKIVDFIDEADGSMKLKDSKAKASNKHLSPVVKVLGDDGKMTEGSLNLLIPKGTRDTKSFGQITGGRVIFKTPKGEQFLVSGSAEDIRNAFKQIKGDNPYVEAVTLDNGTYAMGLRNKNQKITAQQLKDYQGENTSGSAFLYLKPGNYTRGSNEAAPQSQFRDVPMNTPNIRTKNDESFKKGHSLTNEQKAIILHHTGYSDTTGVSKGMSKAMQGVNKQFSNPGESSHVVIDFDGTRYNYARPDQVTFHAGKSMMDGRDNVNDFGVGIEFQGDTDKTRLTDKQINSFVEYAGPIIKKNKIPLSSIITHKQIRTNYMKANPKDRDVLGKPDVNEIDYERILKALKKKGYYAQGGPVVDPMGQWAHPGKVTRIPGSDITMQGVNYPVLGVGSNGKKQMMYPGKDYSFGGAEHVDEYPMMQNGGNDLPEVTVYGHRNPTAKAYFDRWRKEAEDWQDRESPVNSPMSSYLAGEQMYSKYKGHDIKMLDKQDRPMLRVTPFSDTLQIHNPESDYRGDSLISELAHKVQLNKKGNLGFIKSHIGNDYLNTLKNMSLGDIFNADSWKSAYDKNYYAPGTQEYEAHSVIEPKLREEFKILADKEYDKLTASKNKMKGGGYVVTRSHDRKGKTHKVTGPGGVVKYFGDSKLGQHPNDPKRKAAFYARHKSNLAGNPFFRAFARKTWEDGGTIPPYQMAGQVSKTDSVRHQADKILKYEQLRGGPGGAPLSQYSNPKYMDMLMGNVYPEVRKIMPNASAMEAGEAMDFIFNAGWDKANNKITKDPRAFALQEYYRENDGSKLDADGKWAGRKNAPYSFNQEYDGTIGKLPENQRRVLMNKGRDWYYRNINNPAPGVPNSDYNDTWYGRIWNTNDYQPFNPNNPNFTPKKQMGGVASGKQDLEKKHGIKVTYKK